MPAVTYAAPQLTEGLNYLCDDEAPSSSLGNSIASDVPSFTSAIPSTAAVELAGEIEVDMRARKPCISERELADGRSDRLLWRILLHAPMYRVRRYCEDLWLVRE